MNMSWGTGPLHKESGVGVGVLPGPSAEGPLPPRGQTDRAENITFQQLN